MSKIYRFLLLISISFYSGIKLNAQQRIDMSHIDLMVSYGGPAIEFYQKVGVDNYQTFRVSVSRNHHLLSAKLYPVNKIKTLNEITKYDKFTPFYVDELKEISTKEFFKKRWIINHEWLRESEKKNQLILKFLKPDLATIQKFHYSDRKPSGGLGMEYIKHSDDQEKKQRVYEATYLPTIDLDFGNNKHIYLYSDGYTIANIVFPLEETTLFTQKSIESSNLIETNLYPSNTRDDFSFFMDFGYGYEDYYSLKKDKNKYKLLSPFKDNLLGKAYDSITYNNHFIIAKNKDEVKIYNSFLDEITIADLKNAYLSDQDYMEVATNTDAYYINANMEVFDEKPKISYILCGSVGSTDYHLEKTKDSKQFVFSIIDSNFGSSFTDNYILEDIKNGQQLTFLSAKTSCYKDENSDFVNDPACHPELLVVSKNNKYGIIKYDYKKAKKVSKPKEPQKKGNKTKTDNFPVIIDSFGQSWYSLTGNIVLPVNNDSIVFDNNLIIYYKNNKAGIFPWHKTVQYDVITKKTASFYAIVKNGKQGILDISTKKEFFIDDTKKVIE